MFKGLITALVTPFKNEQVDIKAYQDFIDWQIKSGVNGILVCGTTGETPTLTDIEREKVIKSAIEVANKRVPVMVGTGTNSTTKTIEYTKDAKKFGADAALIVSPYYNKPTPEGQFQHFRAINDHVDFDIYLYNNPGRSVIGMSDELLKRLIELSNVKGIKESSGDIARPLSLKLMTKNKPEFKILSGDDIPSLAFNASGGVGTISVTANVAPKQLADMHQHLANGEIDKALDIQLSLYNLHKSMFVETNPTPAKYALSLLGKMHEDVRLPLVNLDQNSKTIVKNEMIKAGLLD